MNSDTNSVRCSTLYNAEKLVAREKLTFRPSVYGIVVHENKVLVIVVQSSGKYGLPGGAIELGESIEDALKREIREETGLEVVIERFERFSEGFFYYDPLDVAFHSFLFFYRCRPVTFTLATAEEIDDAEATKPCWLPIDQLRADDFQEYSKIIVPLLQGQP